MVEIARLTTSSNLSTLGFSLEASRDFWEVAPDLLQSMVQRPAHNQPAIPLPDSYDVIVQVEPADEFPLRFRFPFLTLRVSDADRDGVFVVTDSFSRVYGEGNDPGMAVGDYLDSLFARFLDLDQHEDILAPGLRRDLTELRRYIVRTR